MNQVYHLSNTFTHENSLVIPKKSPPLLVIGFVWYICETAPEKAKSEAIQCPIWEGKQAHWKPRPPPTGRRDVVTVAVRCAGFRGQGSCQGLQIHYTPVTPSDSSGPMLKMARLYK